MTKREKFFYIAAFVFTPFLAFAQLERDARAFTDGDGRTFTDVIKLFLEIIMLAIPVLVAASMLAFLWGIAMFLFKADDPKSHNDGKNLMVWGIIALFILVSLWGILGFAIGDTFGGSLGIPFLPEGGKKN